MSRKTMLPNPCHPERSIFLRVLREGKCVVEGPRVSLLHNRPGRGFSRRGWAVACFKKSGNVPSVPVFATRITSKNEFVADAGALTQLQSGAVNIYIYGKIPYSDVFHIGHEAHFCGLYQVVEGADPLKLSHCPTYNDTE